VLAVVANQTAGFLTVLALQSRNRVLRQFPFNKPDNEINVSKTKQFPNPILDGLGLSANTQVGLSVWRGRLIVEPHARPRYTLSVLVLVSHELKVADGFMRQY
jgi:hypothetical protein